MLKLFITTIFFLIMITANAQDKVVGYHVHGHGPDKVIILHDWNGDHKNWKPLTKYLSSQKFTYAFMDVRGQGLSLGMDGEYTIKEIAEDVFSLADHLGWNQFSLIGHSFTTLAAQVAAGSDRKSRIEKVILVCGFPAQGVKFSANEMSFFRSAINNREVTEQAMAGLTGGRYSRNWGAVMAQSYLETSEAGPSRSYFESFANKDYSQKVKSMEKPVLVITAEYDYPSLRYDRVKPPFDELNYKNVQFENINNSGHYPNLETPVYLATVLEKFLEK